MEKKSGSKESVKKERGEGQMERGTVYQLQQKRYHDQRTSIFICRALNS